MLIEFVIYHCMNLLDILIRTGNELFSIHIIGVLPPFHQRSHTMLVL